MNVWLYTLGSVGSLSLLSLLGVVALSRKGLHYLNRLLTYFISLAAGVMLGGAVFHLLPEAAQAMGTGKTFSLVLAASFVAFFALEKFLLLHHHGVSENDLPAHDDFHHDHQHNHNENYENNAPRIVRPMVWINLIGGAIHNFVDGVTIAVTFLIYPTLGVTTVLATTLHEIPREIGDFAVLIHGGLPVKRAILFNLLTSLAAIVGAVSVLILGSHLKGYADWLLPIAAANFLYIALANLLPELAHVRSRRQSVKQITLVIIGLAMMYSLKQIAG